MTIQEAFKILDISITSTIEEIDKKYKALIKEVHPDKKNGDTEKASTLNNAREVAINYINEMNTSSAMIRQVVELIKVDNTAIVKRQEYRTQSDSIFSRATRRSINKYKQMQSMAKLFGAFSAALALVSSNIIPIFAKYFDDNPIYPAFFTMLTFTTGTYYLMLNTMTERIKDSLEDVKETLEDKSSYYDIVNSILLESPDLNKVFSKKEFEKTIQNWLLTSQYVMLEKLELDILIDKDNLRRTARRIGESDFSKLIIAKGLEKGILKEIELTENGLPTVGFSFETKKTST